MPVNKMEIKNKNNFHYTCFTIITSVSGYTPTSVAIYTLCATSSIFTWIVFTVINICNCKCLP